MTLQESIKILVTGQSLNQEQAAGAMCCLMRGEATPAQVGAFLVALRMKGETVAEITGFAETMRQFATVVPATRRPLVDTCGTGGDHSGTFNISTTAAFVVAGAGVAVAKHGNRSATSQCGSADVLEALGVNIALSPERVAACIDQVGIGFLFARALHGAMKHVAPIRAELPTRTVFNLLGPLANPAGADGQVMGVFSPDLVEPIAGVLLRLGVRHAFVVSGREGLDEISLSGPSVVAEVAQGRVATHEWSPEQFGFSTAPRESLTGGNAAVNGAILQAVLEGEQGPRRDIVLLNAAPALIAGAVAGNMDEGLARARHAIDSGAARECLAALVRFSNKATS